MVLLQFDLILTLYALEIHETQYPVLEIDELHHLILFPFDLILTLYELEIRGKQYRFLVSVLVKLM